MRLSHSALVSILFHFLLVASAPIPTLQADTVGCIEHDATSGCSAFGYAAATSSSTYSNSLSERGSKGSKMTLEDATMYKSTNCNELDLTATCNVSYGGSAASDKEKAGSKAWKNSSETVMYKVVPSEGEEASRRDQRRGGGEEGEEVKGAEGEDVGNGRLGSSRNKFSETTNYNSRDGVPDLDDNTIDLDAPVEDRSLYDKVQAMSRGRGRSSSRDKLSGSAGREQERARGDFSEKEEEGDGKLGEMIKGGSSRGKFYESAGSRRQVPAAREFA